MKTLTLIALIPLIAAAFAPAASAAEPAPEDRAAIEACVRDYIEGWYDGDAARMERALHPDLAKRTVRTLSEGAGQVLNSLSCSAMIAYTKAGLGTKQKRPDLAVEVKILDVQANTASARSVTPDFIDHIHLARIDGRWRIVNVLWEPPASGQ